MGNECERLPGAENVGACGRAEGAEDGGGGRAAGAKGGLGFIYRR